MLLGCAAPPDPAVPRTEGPTGLQRDAAQVVPTRDRGPVIERIELGPEAPTVTTDLVVEIATHDPDDDYVEIVHRWLVNGRPLAGERHRSLSRRRFRKGDVVQVEVEASDGTLTTLGRSAQVRIRNAPPAILNRPRDLTRVEGFRIRAEDPDDDPLSYRLRDAPPGLSVDPVRGILHWSGSETEIAGTYRVGIQVQDPEGAYARWTFGLSVEAGSGVTRTVPAKPPEEAPPDTASPAEVLPPRGASPVEAFEPPSRW